MEDERYRRGQIYTIRNIKDDTMIYVGSTIDGLSKRFYKHKMECKSEQSKITLHKLIINNDWSDWYIELYEMYPCNNKKELERREGQVIREIGTINKNIAGRTIKEWCEDNNDKLKKYYKEWYNDNKEEISQKSKEYYNNNKEEKLEYQKKYTENNFNKIKEYHKEWREKNIDKIKEKVCCGICGSFVCNSGLKRHQQTKKCMEALNNTTSNIQDCE
jgi:hypothetical protein